MLGIHPEAQGMALMQSSPLEAARCTLALTFKGIHSVLLGMGYCVAIAPHFATYFDLTADIAVYF